LSLPDFPSEFNQTYSLKNNSLTRSRKFNPSNFFTSILHLSTSTNNNSYLSALRKTWNNFEQNEKDVPVKSSLSEFRNNVSYNFFKDIYRDHLSQLSRQTFKGFHIYAIDGDQFDLPASKEIISNGYRGYPVKGKRETHYPKM